MSKLILSIGPMKSGKSFEIISYFAPLKHSNLSFGLFQPSRNVRDEKLQSRNGVIMEAKKLSSLEDIADTQLDVVGIDEFHMFEEKDVDIIARLLKRKIRIIISGLDTDYKGKLFPVIKKLLELGPEKVVYKKSVCEKCKNFNATHTQVFRKDNSPVLDGMPSVIPDDGSFIYKPVCRDCFVKKAEI